ncbi:MAG: hypothetical protein KAQ94_04595 [Arcobacteraceae bacterium]|nr:hypothetical protein [Arcobacteraceae bacterium]
MSSLSYRVWDTWKNSLYFEENKIYNGYYECIIEPTLMAHQTVEFIIEKYEIRDFIFQIISSYPAQFKNSIMFTQEGELCLKIYTNFNTSDNVKNIVTKIEEFIHTVSVLTDFPLICNKFRFIDSNIGKLLVANRKSIGRGLSFEVEERNQASNKIENEIIEYENLNQSDDYFKAGLKHYLSGMKLLSLEDQVNGLLDASFMQFYQGCEVLCQDPRGNLENSKKYIARNIDNNSRELQIIAHQLWRVRNKYFGHGDKDYNIIANANIQSIKNISNQILVARYLCRALLDSYISTQNIFLREVRLYTINHSSSYFNGDINSFNNGNDFYASYDRRMSKIYNNQGREVEEYRI